MNFFNRFIKNESGRSMVEILGVLAIIGVLSVGAIAGYRYAWNKNKANQIVDGLSKAQVTVSTIMRGESSDIFLSGDSTISELSINLLREDHGLEEYDPIVAACAEKSFDVILNNVPTAVCEILVDKGVGSYYAVDVRNQDNPNYDALCRELKDINMSCESNEEVVQMAFAFESTEALTPLGPCKTDSDCANECQVCENQQCVIRSDCGNGCGWLSYGHYGCCGSGTTLCGGYCCDTTAGYKCSNDQCVNDDNCPPDKKLKIRSTCYSCYHTSRIVVSTDAYKAACTAQCPGIREVSGNYCVLADCDGFRDYYGYCYACDYSSGISNVTQEECSKCSDREMDGSSCVKKCDGVRNSTGTCYACDYPNEIYTTKTECDKCPDREMKGSYCALKKCDGFRNSTGTHCYACDDSSRISTTKKECDKCSNREMYNGYCILKTECDGFRDYYGNCYACDYSGSASGVSENECKKCSNREMSGGYCVSLDFCDIKDQYGACYACDSSSSIYVQASECGKCLNRYMNGNYCYKCNLGYYNPSGGSTCKKCPDRLSITNEAVCTACGYTWNSRQGCI